MHTQKQKKQPNIKRARGESITQAADLERVAKAKRWLGLVASLSWMKRVMACLTHSSLFRGLPSYPVVFISTVDSASTSTQMSMSSLGSTVSRDATSPVMAALSSFIRRPRRFRLYTFFLSVAAECFAFLLISSSLSCSYEMETLRFY